MGTWTKHRRRVILVLRRITGIIFCRRDDADANDDDADDGDDPSPSD